uniref:Uncharacterized protein n=1 Tax=Anguilla anguilla TaxID=7936 RepID=A0A0E9WMY9_ANGAN
MKPLETLSWLLMHAHCTGILNVITFLVCVCVKTEYCCVFTLNTAVITCPFVFYKTSFCLLETGGILNNGSLSREHSKF